MLLFFLFLALFACNLNASGPANEKAFSQNAQKTRHCPCNSMQSIVEGLKNASLTILASFIHGSRNTEITQEKRKKLEERLNERFPGYLQQTPPL